VLVDSATSWLKTVGNEIGKVAPGAIQGALTGFMTGGPAGAALGAVGGGASAYLKGTAPAPAMTPVVAQQPNAAALQLLAALLRPEVIQALGAIANPAGPQTVSVAGTQVPAAAVANLLASLAGNAVTPTMTALPRAEDVLSLLHEAAGEDDDYREAWAEEDELWNEALDERDLADLERLGDW
jgi:hypothetical protein